MFFFSQGFLALFFFFNKKKTCFLSLKSCFFEVVVFVKIFAGSLGVIVIEQFSAVQCGSVQFSAVQCS